MNGQNIEEILKDLYKIDPSLMKEEVQLKKIIHELLSSRPEAEMDEEFRKELKEKILTKFSQKKERRKIIFAAWFNRKLLAQIAGGAAALSLVVVVSLNFWNTKNAGRPLQDLNQPAVSTQIAVPKNDYQGRAMKAKALYGVSQYKPGGPAKRAPDESLAYDKKELSAPVAEAEAPSIAGKAMRMREEKERAKITAGKDDQNLAQPSRDEEFNTEQYDRIYENPFLEAVKDPLSTVSIDVDTASYANVRRFLNSGSLPAPDAVRIEELVNYFKYDYSGPTNGTPLAFNTELSECPWNKSHELFRLGIQGKTINPEALPPNNLVFLIDVSGSMEDENKLPLIKPSLKLLVNQMRSIDHIAIVVYAGNAGLVLPSTSGSDKKKIIEAIDNLEAGGSTAGSAGIQLAYETAKKNFIPKGNNRVILATDGDFNVGPSSDGELIRMIEDKRKEGIFLTALGFGMGNYKDSKMQKLADKGNGNYAYIDSLSEAKKVLVSQMMGTLYTIAKDVKIQIEFNPAIVKEYRLIGYEKRVMAARDFNDDQKDAGELGAGHSVTVLYEIVPSDGQSAGNDLKYQTAAVKPEALTNKEMMTIKFRYKNPGGEQSRLLSYPISHQVLDFSKTTVDYRFAASVAEWGLLLRHSEFKGSANFRQVIDLADQSRGKDAEGYRAEFIKLAKLSKDLSK